MVMVAICLSGLSLIDPTPQVTLFLDTLYKQLVWYLENAPLDLDFLQAVLANHLGKAYHLPLGAITSIQAIRLLNVPSQKAYEAYMAVSLANYLVDAKISFPYLLEPLLNNLELSLKDRSLLVISSSLSGLKAASTQAIQSLCYNLEIDCIVLKELFSRIEDVLNTAIRGLSCLHNYQPEIANYKYIIGIHCQRTLIIVLQMLVSKIITTLPTLTFVSPTQIHLSMLAVPKPNQAGLGYIQVYTQFMANDYTSLNKALLDIISQTSSFPIAKSYLQHILEVLQKVHTLPLPI
ncbi:hypothetical protein DSO57_1038181 [Entomophthora muscae]|uniref:Uncharacterized protein n=1 Tax=Entomophthora muscae TaxID=34485 RepID=A0ACC2SBX1_9FUNG|nr:hypothetical protein DSO57_1038181 [Entomophthora muscae]